ncbi:hypothetical protein Q4485_14275 [Granulosicoccaceae sp. 1_MG-2023]|nr:hypothetical protein [Granulosicoccaceae sp. 1_MG-2023]
MKHTLPAASALLLALASSTVHAETTATNGNSIRVDISANSSSTVLDDGFDELTIWETSLQGTLTLQSSYGVYGELGVANITVQEIEIDGRTYDVDEDYDANLFGVGYRFPNQIWPSQYWGIGYRHADSDGSDSNAVRLFSEKDTDLRYGIIEFSYASGDDSDLFSLSGRHVWFLNDVIGLGVNWGVSFGSIDTPSGYADIDTGAANIGGILMIRPRF